LDAVPDLKDMVAADRATPALSRCNGNVGHGPRTDREARSARLRIHWTQFLLKPGVAYKLSDFDGRLKACSSGQGLTPSINARCWPGAVFDQLVDHRWIG
jgi:hypothetical protein